VLLFLECYKGPLQEVIDMLVTITASQDSVGVGGQEQASAKEPRFMFHHDWLGGTQRFPFHGLVVTKVPAAAPAPSSSSSVDAQVVQVVPVVPSSDCGSTHDTGAINGRDASSSGPKSIGGRGAEGAAEGGVDLQAMCAGAKKMKVRILFE
jgi:hypothetical protein